MAGYRIALNQINKQRDNKVEMSALRARMRFKVITKLIYTHRIVFLFYFTLMANPACAFFLKNAFLCLSSTSATDYHSSLGGFY